MVGVAKSFAQRIVVVFFFFLLKKEKRVLLDDKLAGNISNFINVVLNSVEDLSRREHIVNERILISALFHAYESFIIQSVHGTFGTSFLPFSLYN